MDVGNLGNCRRQGGPEIKASACPNWQEHGGELEFPPIGRYYVSSRRAGDLLSYPAGVLVIAADKASLLVARSLTGMELRPTDLFSDPHCKNPLNGYAELRITGRVKADKEQSGMRLKYKCALCGVERWSHWDREMGLHFEGDPKNWPDIFLMDPAITGFVFVSADFADAVIDLKISPAALTRLEDLELYTI